MGVWYTIYNATRKERLYFNRASATKRREIAGNPVAAGAVAWYLVTRAGDRIFADPDDGSRPWPLYWVRRKTADKWPNVEETILAEMEAAGLIRDIGPLCPEDPELVGRIFELIWQEKSDGTRPVWPPNCGPKKSKPEDAQSRQ